jgi:Cu2+-exporting ATPase
VLTVHTLALLTFVDGWALGLEPREALLRTATLLIITCPCALGLAVPAVQITASGRLFRKGVLVKSGAALENFTLSGLYNLAAAPAAMLGLVNPFIAALAMSGSSLLVTLTPLE